MSRPATARRVIIAALGCLALLLFAFLAASPASFGASPKPAQSAPAPTSAASSGWVAPDPASIPKTPLGDSIRLGIQVFNDTPKYAEKYVGNRMACTHCHIDGGTVSEGMPMIGLPGIFPMYRERENEVITFEERIEQCFQRSEFGHRVPNNDPIMVGLVAYTQWLSRDQVTGKPYSGRGLVNLPELTGDVTRGSAIYQKNCALCHGSNGAGQPPTYPALWGPDSYSDGAGMNQIAKMAAFVQHNMPQTDPGSLSPQEAYDVAAFVHSKPHSVFVMKDHM